MDVILSSWSLDDVLRQLLEVVLKIQRLPVHSHPRPWQYLAPWRHVSSYGPYLSFLSISISLDVGTGYCFSRTSLDVGAGRCSPRTSVDVGIVRCFSRTSVDIGVVGCFSRTSVDVGTGRVHHVYVHPSTGHCFSRTSLDVGAVCCFSRTSVDVGAVCCFFRTSVDVGAVRCFLRTSVDVGAGRCFPRTSVDVGVVRCFSRNLMRLAVPRFLAEGDFPLVVFVSLRPTAAGVGVCCEKWVVRTPVAVISSDNLHHRPSFLAFQNWRNNALTGSIGRSLLLQQLRQRRRESSIFVPHEGGC